MCIRDRGYVSPENRAKVQAAIEQLQYKPNLVARGLRTKTTKQILYLMPDVNNAYYLEVFSEMCIRDSTWAPNWSMGQKSRGTCRWQYRQMR